MWRAREIIACFRGRGGGGSAGTREIYSRGSGIYVELSGTAFFIARFCQSALLRFQIIQARITLHCRFSDGKRNFSCFIFLLCYRYESHEVPIWIHIQLSVL